MVWAKDPITHKLMTSLIYHLTVESIDFIRPLEDVTVTRTGDEAVFTCEISKSGLRATWLKDGREITTDRNYEITVTGGVHKLTISKADSRDIGDYCIVIKGNRSAARLMVEAKPEFTEQKYTEKIVLRSGQSSVFEVPFTGSPQPQVTWSHGGDILHDSRRIKVDVIYNMTSLGIGRAERADSGTYKLALSNNFGSVSMTIEVVVLGEFTQWSNIIELCS